MPPFLLLLLVPLEMLHLESMRLHDRGVRNKGTSFSIGIFSNTSDTHPSAQILCAHRCVSTSLTDGHAGCTSTTHANCSMKCLREMWLLGTQWSQAIPNMVTFKAHVHSSIPCLWGTLHPDPLWLPARWPTAGGTKALQYFKKWWWMGHSDLLVWCWQHWSRGVRTWVLFVC